MTPLELKEKLLDARSQYRNGDCDIDALYAAADAYIDSLKAYKKRTKAKLNIPSRGYLLRAL
jgi:N-formylglutamate amidohydrolase